MLFVFMIGACAATLLGGLCALRLKDRLHLILGFSAGAVLGVAFFDLMPEAFALAAQSVGVSALFTTIAAGFLAYMLIERYVALHSHSDHETHTHTHSGFFGAATLCLHSFLDGVGMGLAFKVSPEVGLVVALAVLAHDFSDGINTVSMVHRSGQGRNAWRWVIADALAPVFGVIATLFFTVTSEALGLLLALFGGFFLYIGAADLLPESHHRHPVIWTTLSSAAGVALLYLVVNAGGF
jgi:ZIP family zinc transporter